MAAERLTFEALPWLHPHLARLARYWQRGRPPQAFLLTGPEGVGKRFLARALGQICLCRERRRCGVCAECRLVEQQSHPDLREVAPESAREVGLMAAEKETITIDQVRDISQWLAHASERGRVVIFSKSERLHPAAADALLKTVEEPPQGALLLFLTDGLANRLPATLRSRCQIIRLPPPPRSEALHWLKQQGVDAETAQLALLRHRGPLAALWWTKSEAPKLRQAFWQDLRAWFKGRLALPELSGRWENHLLLVVGELLIWLRNRLVEGRGAKEGRELARLAYDLLELQREVRSHLQRRLLLERLLLNLKEVCDEVIGPDDCSLAN